MSRLVRRVLAGLLPIALAGCGESSDVPHRSRDGADTAGRPNLVLIVIDTLRADRVSAYGHEQPTTPAFDALAARGILFENASSTSSWTLPAHASLFTGTYPWHHRATQVRPRLDQALPTLAEILRSYGYATFASSGNPLVGRATGLERGFERFEEAWRARPVVRAEEHAHVQALRRFLSRARASQQPLFAFVNVIEPHAPYWAPEPFRRRFASLAPADFSREDLDALSPVQHYLSERGLPADRLALLSQLYDAEVAWADAILGALVGELARAGARESTWVVVTSDHGENLGDHGQLGHVFDLHRSTVQVPLLLVPPAGHAVSERRAQPVSLLDVFTTLLARAGVATRDAGDSRDLWSAAGEDLQRAVFAAYGPPRQAMRAFASAPEELRRALLARRGQRWQSAEQGRFRLLRRTDGRGERDELYELASDPLEAHDLAGDPAYAETRARLSALLPEPTLTVSPSGAGELGAELEPGAAELDAATRARLCELGYLPCDGGPSGD